MELIYGIHLLTFRDIELFFSLHFFYLFLVFSTLEEGRAEEEKNRGEKKGGGTVIYIYIYIS